MVKFRLFYDRDKEQEWLNEMCGKGWAMESFFAGFFTFKPCKPGEYIYQVDMLRSFDGKNYKEFMQDMNVEIVQQWVSWVLLRKKKADGPFELYTDDASKIEHYTRIRNFFKVFAIITIILMSTWMFIMLRFGDISLLFPIILFAVLLILFIRQAVRSNIKILKLKGLYLDKHGKAPFSLLLVAGMLLNSLVLIVRRIWEEFFADGTGHTISLVITSIALLLMLGGVFLQVRKMHKK